MKTSKICPVCNREFIAIRDNIIHCSLTCKKQANHEIRICVNCNISFLTYKYRPTQFCSMSCASQFRNRGNLITQTCEACGNEYRVKKSQVKHHGSSCCSRECLYAKMSKIKQGVNNPNYRGGKVKSRGRNWRHQSRLALKRDGHRCQICHKRLNRKAWDYGVHHIKPYRDFYGDYKVANQLSNLVTLCRSCHGKVEWGSLPCPIPLL